MKIKSIVQYFTKVEIWLWTSSVLCIVFSFCVFDRANYLTLMASLVGVTSLIFNAKGNPFGQVLMIVFSILYGIISFAVGYYGEMITYLGMTAPMALFALVSWLKNPYKGHRSEVKINQLKGKEAIWMLLLTGIVTVAFYFVLDAFHTANMIPSTISVTTSFLAVYLTCKRSAYFALAYAANDVVLILLWIMAAFHNLMYLSVVVCFAAFLMNDIYGYISWRKMYDRQNESF